MTSPQAVTLNLFGDPRNGAVCFLVPSVGSIILDSVRDLLQIIFIACLFMKHMLIAIIIFTVIIMNVIFIIIIVITIFIIVFVIVLMNIVVFLCVSI